MATELWQAWWSGPWLLLLLPLVLRWLPLRGEGRDPAWSWRIDGLVAPVLGLGLAGLFTTTMVHPVADTFPLSASDFDQYCEMVARVADGTAGGYFSPRFTPPAWFPASISQHLGIIDALAVQSLLALAIASGALYLWGWAVHSRTAGVLAALLTAAVAPLVFMVRDLTFYPVLVAGVASMGAGLALCVRSRGVGAAALLGLACAATLLTDVRGVLYAGPVLGLGVLVALARARSPGTAVLRIGALAAPVALSWLVAHQVVSHDTTGLEEQAVRYLEHAVVAAGGEQGWRETVTAADPTLPGFLWGHSSPLALPVTFLRLQQLGQALPAVVRAAPNSQVLRAEYVTPWLLPALVASALVLGGLARRPWRLLALLGGTLPCLLMLYSASSALPQERHLATALLPMPLLFGVFIALAADRQGPVGTWKEGPRRWPWRSALLMAAVMLALWGFPGSWLSPAVRWRRGLVQTEPRVTLQKVLADDVDQPDTCSRTLSHQQQRLPAWPSRLYPSARAILELHRNEPLPR